MNILIVSAEVAPFAKTGGLGDVAASYAQYLHKHGHDVRLFLPMYGNLRIDRSTLVPVDFLRGVPVRIGPREFTISVFTAPLPGTDTWVYFIDCPPLYARKAIYSSEGDEHLRFALLSAAALVACQRMAFAPDVAHCNDWHTALLPLYLKTHFAWDQLFARTKTLLTLHNLAYQGVCSASVIPDLGMEEFRGKFEIQDLAAGRVGFMKTGILYADGINAVSRTYAQEIQTPDHGFGLDGLLRARSATVTGITNGVDYDVWNPETDPHIAANYSASDLSGKSECKQALLKEAGLPHSETTPLIGIVSRLTKQKGFELGYDVFPEMLKRYDVQMVVLGSGDPTIAGYFARLARAFPRKMKFMNRYDDALAHRIEAGSDMFLMPSYFEPCGLNQMYSLRYGTIPIVRRTGGLADTVQLFDRSTGKGTGIVFDHYSATGLGWALEVAFGLWDDQGAWSVMQQNAMAEDNSWDRQIQKYVQLYQSL